VSEPREAFAARRKLRPDQIVQTPRFGAISKAARECQLHISGIEAEITDHPKVFGEIAGDAQSDAMTVLAIPDEEWINRQIEIEIRIPAEDFHGGRLLLRTDRDDQQTHDDWTKKKLLHRLSPFLERLWQE